ncbi:histidine kinase-like protein [Branchiibius hedensis]|uniref:Histidine kinase-like ATPase domain-containing protein n=1 Tax=Branchiibius hedensis TaxID=672460 RepID=A0A2Y8ZXN6_9MICO|nr:ATP-binding protein [Branchiibius hedensis]PWJ27237.1 histidine kinase-like protein [Branchiibius hedensis]SSA36048.1 Histidine kinase-like ATPase domain-containing protein [Branchiibius hedensis]
MTDNDGTEGTDAHVRTVRLAWDLQSVPRIRKAVLEDLAGTTVPEQVVQETEQVASELVANAILHGKPLPDGSIRVHWKVRPPRVEIEVSDGGSGKTPAPKPSSEWARSGRGLRIVRSLAHEWGVSDEDGRTTVWAALGGPSRRRM